MIKCYSAGIIFVMVAFSVLATEPDTLEEIAAQAIVKNIISGKITTPDYVPEVLLNSQTFKTLSLIVFLDLYYALRNDHSTFSQAIKEKLPERIWNSLWDQKITMDQLYEVLNNKPELKAVVENALSHETKKFLARQKVEYILDFQIRLPQVQGVTTEFSFLAFYKTLPFNKKLKRASVGYQANSIVVEDLIEQAWYHDSIPLFILLKIQEKIMEEVIAGLKLEDLYQYFGKRDNQLNILFESGMKYYANSTIINQTDLLKINILLNETARYINKNIINLDAFTPYIILNNIVSGGEDKRIIGISIERYSFL